MSTQKTPRIFILFVILLVSNKAYLQTDSILSIQLEKFRTDNESIYDLDQKQFLSGTDLARTELEIDSVFDIWQSEYFKRLESSTFVVDVFQKYSETVTEDDTLSNKQTTTLRKIIVPIVTRDGDSIKITFGTTKSDGINANLPVNQLLSSSLIEALTIANKNLADMKSPPIKEIYISATTNGKHGKYSNHYSGNAVDISRINGVFLIETNRSMILSGLFRKYLRNKRVKARKTIKFEKKTYKMDLLLLFERVNELQLAFESMPRRRENFGPIYNTKFRIEDSGQRLEVPVHTTHKDHIHFSVR